MNDSSIATMTGKNNNTHRSTETRRIATEKQQQSAEENSGECKVSECAPELICFKQEPHDVVVKEEMMLENEEHFEEPVLANRIKKRWHEFGLELPQPLPYDEGFVKQEALDEFNQESSLQASCSSLDSTTLPELVKCDEELQKQTFPDSSTLQDTATYGQQQSEVGTTRKYSESDVKAACGHILNKGWTVYKASKEFGIPYNSLKKRLQVAVSLQEMQIPKRGRPFNLTHLEESKIVKYVTDMQSFGFDLTATEIRKYAFEIARKGGRQKNSFNAKKGIAGWDWWLSFKERYGFSAKVPENSSVNRATASKKENVMEFYDTLQGFMEKYDLTDKPHLMWNIGETDFSYVIKPDKVSPKSEKTINQQTSAVLVTVNAYGTTGPFLMVLKGQRCEEQLKQTVPKESLIMVTINGCINKDIFIEFLKHFVKHIPLERPVLLLIDSHSSHISPDALKFAQENRIIFITFPSHTMHFLQPLDVAIFGPMKKCWGSKLVEHRKKSRKNPTRHDFITLFMSVLQESVTTEIVENGFTKTGIFPFNRNAVPEATLNTPKVHYPPNFTCRVEDHIPLMTMTSKVFENNQS